jgi:nucleolar protein 14
MAKRKYQAKSSSLPKGLPLPKNKKARVNYNSSINPFESARASSAKAPKFQVHNRPVSGRSNPLNPIKGAGSALKRAIENRKLGLKQSLEKSKKAGTFIDRRIGESRKDEMTQEERILARIVRERSRRSKKLEKYSLENDDHHGNVSGARDDALQLTHRGKLIDEHYDGKLEPGDFLLSDDDEDRYGGQLEKADTELHFGGGAFDRDRARQALSNPYGPAGQEVNESLSDRYRSRRQELEDLIMRKKYEKAEKAKSKEEQVEKFQELDDNFKELARLLNFRDKEQDRKARLEAKQAGTLTQDEQEMDEWEKEMKGYLFERKVKATDRTKTPEEIAKEEADRLHELETRRLARMNGDFENDDFSDISDDDGDAHKRQKRRKKTQKPTNKEARNPDELDSDDEGDDGNVLQTKFTEDGLVYINKQGEIVGKVGEGDDPIQGNGNKRVDGDSTENSEVEDSDDIGDSEEDASVESGDGLSEGEESDLEEITYEVGTKVKGKYLADQQMEGKAKWYKGSITKVTQDTKGNTLYEILYDDGDIEENVRPENVRRQKVDVEEAKAEESKRAQIANLSLKRQKAKQKAR